jgi:hypothetical protein
MGRFLGYLFMSAALGALGYDVWRGPMKNLPLDFTSTAQFWSDFHRPGLEGAKEVVEEMLPPDSWGSFILPVITLPAFVLAGSVGLLLFAFTFSKRRSNSRDGMMFPRNRR